MLDPKPTAKLAGTVALGKRITTNFVYFLSGELVAKFVGYLAIVWIARKLGADNFGRLGFAESFFSYFIFVGIAGVDTIATRNIARNKNLASKYMGNIILLKSALCLLAYGLLAVFTLTPGLSPELRRLTLLYGLCLLPIALSAEWLFLGVEKPGYIGLFRILRELLFLGGVWVVLQQSLSIYFIPLARVVAMTVASLFLLACIKRLKVPVRLQTNMHLWKELLKQSFPILTSQLLLVVMYTFSIILLGFLNKNEEVGYFVAIQKIVLFSFGLSGIFWSVVFPNTSRLYHSSREQLCHLQEVVSRTVLVVAVPLGIIGYMLADKIVPFLYGPDYAESIPVLKVLIWIAAFGFINSIFAQGLLACDSQHLFFVTVLIQTFIVVGMVIFLVPQLGAVGASISWLTAEVCGFFIYKAFHNKTVKFPFYRYMVKPVLASLLIVLILNYFQNLKSIIAFPLCFVAYFIVMLIIRGIKISELRLLYTNFVTK